MYSCPWRQVNVAFPDWAGAERRAVAHLAPLLAAAEADGLITAWFFVRKAPCWRVRYLPTGNPAAATSYIHGQLEVLKRQRHIADVTITSYEPETHAFGGTHGMAGAHRLFHLDSRYLLDHLADRGRGGAARHRRELSILLCSTLLRAAGLDWYERGDVWARVAAHRAAPHQLPVDKATALRAAVRRLMIVDLAALPPQIAPRILAAGWAQAYAAAGQELAELNTGGRLQRGLRSVLAHHIIFAWNRLGLPASAQAVLSTTAKAVVFGPDLTAPTPATHPAGRTCEGWTEPSTA